MEFFIHKEVLELGVRIKGVFIEGIDNTYEDDIYLAWRRQKTADLLQKYSGFDIKRDEILEGFYRLHEKVNVPRRKNIPASENLIKLLVKHQDLYRINKAVDIYNIISLESKLALGAHDTDLIDGNIHLRITDGSESFVPLGGTGKPVKAGEYSYIDDAGDILCWLEIRQSEKDKVTDNTRNLFYIIQGNEKTPDELLQHTAEEIIDLTTRFCGGRGFVAGTVI